MAPYLENRAYPSDAQFIVGENHRGEYHAPVTACEVRAVTQEKSGPGSGPDDSVSAFGGEVAAIGETGNAAGATSPLRWIGTREHRPNKYDRVPGDIAAKCRRWVDPTCGVSPDTR
jgi:hypothetical protein